MPFLSFIISILLLSACSSPLPDAPLKNTYWSLTELFQVDINNAPNQPEVHVVFHINDNTLHGSDGCNQIQADYQIEDSVFSITQIISTDVFCKHGREQATRFLQALRLCDKIKIVGDQLIFYQKNRQIARFEAKDDF